MNQKQNACLVSKEILTDFQLWRSVEEVVYEDMHGKKLEWTDHELEIALRAFRAGWVAVHLKTVPRDREPRKHICGCCHIKPISRNGLCVDCQDCTDAPIQRPCFYCGKPAGKLTCCDDCYEKVKDVRF